MNHDSDGVLLGSAESKSFEEWPDLSGASLTWPVVVVLMCRNLSANCANFKEQSAFRKISYALKLCILSYPLSFRLSSFLIPCLPCLSWSFFFFSFWVLLVMVFFEPFLNLQVCATICVFLQNCSCIQWYALSSSELFPLRFHERISDLFICWVELHGVIEHILKRSVGSSQADFHLLQDLLDQNLIFQARDKVTGLKLCDPWTCTRIAFPALSPVSPSALPPFWFRYAKYPRPLHCREA